MSERYIRTIRDSEKVDPLCKQMLNSTDMRGWTPLAYSAMKGDENVFTLLLNRGSVPDQLVLHCECIHSLFPHLVSDFCSHWCTKNNRELMDVMIQRGVDVNVSFEGSEDNDRPLHAAIANSKEAGVHGISGSVAMVELLLSFGANPNLPNGKGTIITHSPLPFI